MQVNVEVGERVGVFGVGSRGMLRSCDNGVRFGG